MNFIAFVRIERDLSIFHGDTVPPIIRGDGHDMIALADEDQLAILQRARRESVMLKILAIIEGLLAASGGRHFFDFALGDRFDNAAHHCDHAITPGRPSITIVCGPESLFMRNVRP
jgi:hypothetical protein